MVYIELAPRRQQFHVAPAKQKPSSAVSSLLEDIKKRAIKKYSHSLRITIIIIMYIYCALINALSAQSWNMSTVSLLESREQRYIKAVSNNNL